MHLCRLKYQVLKQLCLAILSFGVLLSWIGWKKLSWCTVCKNHRKVSFNIASEASYVYILSSLKTPKTVNFGECLKTWGLWSNSGTRYVNLNITKIDGKCQHFKWDIFVHFKTLCSCENSFCAKIQMNLRFLEKNVLTRKSNIFDLKKIRLSNFSRNERLRAFYLKLSLVSPLQRFLKKNP